MEQKDPLELYHMGEEVRQEQEAHRATNEELLDEALGILEDLSAELQTNYRVAAQLDAAILDIRLVRGGA